VRISIQIAMMAAWPSAIATSPADPEVRAPRDSLGRPLARDSAGIPPVPDDLELAPAETLAYAQELLDRGLAFNAHEVLEVAWKNGPADERMLWQGLTQLAVGITHVQRGNVKGAMRLLRNASTRLANDYRPAPYGVDVAGLVDFAFSRQPAVSQTHASEPVRVLSPLASQEHLPEPVRVPAPAEAVVRGRRVRTGNRPGRRWRLP
jgi:hypothetical protein